MNSNLLSQEEVNLFLSKNSYWKFSNNMIIRKFEFSNFIEAFAFMMKVALTCEKLNHHPNWNNVYSIVEIGLTTHDLGGVSKLDIILAQSIDKLYINK